MSPSQVSREARALKRRHGALLAGEPSFHEPRKDRAADAIEAARLRLQGGERPGRDQLTLDLRP